METMTNHLVPCSVESAADSTICGRIQVAVLVDQVDIPFRGLDAAVPQELGQGSQVNTVHQGGSGKSVSATVELQVRADAGFLAKCRESFRQGLERPGPAMGVDEHKYRMATPE